MITLQILQLLQDNGLGTVAWTGNENGADLFWEKMPQDKAGVWIVSRGAPLRRGARMTQRFDMYARGENDIAGMQKLEGITTFFQQSYGTICRAQVDEAAWNALGLTDGALPSPIYRLAIENTEAISNAGQDAQDRIVWNASAVVTYNKE